MPLTEAQETMLADAASKAEDALGWRLIRKFWGKCQTLYDSLINSDGILVPITPPESQVQLLKEGCLIDANESDLKMWRYYLQKAGAEDQIIDEVYTAIASDWYRLK